MELCIKKKKFCIRNAEFCRSSTAGRWVVVSRIRRQQGLRNKVCATRFAQQGLRNKACATRLAQQGLRNKVCAFVQARSCHERGSKKVEPPPVGTETCSRQQQAARALPPRPSCPRRHVAGKKAVDLSTYKHGAGCELHQHVARGSSSAGLSGTSASGAPSAGASPAPAAAARASRRTLGLSSRGRAPRR